MKKYLIWHIIKRIIVMFIFLHKWENFNFDQKSLYVTGRHYARFNPLSPIAIIVVFLMYFVCFVNNGLTGVRELFDENPFAYTVYKTVDIQINEEHRKIAKLIIWLYPVL